MTSTPTAATGKLKLSAYHGYIADGSEISKPEKDGGGYDLDLSKELARIGTKGGTITVTAKGARDLAEFADALAGAEGQNENTSGARSLYNLAEKARKLADELDASGRVVSVVDHGMWRGRRSWTVTIDGPTGIAEVSAADVKTEAKAIEQAQASYRNRPVISEADREGFARLTKTLNKGLFG